jgi:hypothetical protein
VTLTFMYINDNLLINSDYCPLERNVNKYYFRKTTETPYFINKKHRKFKFWMISQIFEENYGKEIQYFELIDISHHLSPNYLLQTKCILLNVK